MTASDLIKASLRLINAIASGETPTNAEMQDCLSALNIMLNSWSAERLNIHVLTKENFSLANGTAEYTIGSSGTFNTARPQRIEGAYIALSGTNYPLQIVDRERFRDISAPATTGQPTMLYYNPEYPLGKVQVYPTPDSAYTLHLDSWKPFTTLALLTTAVSFPPEYEKALKYNLAVEIAPEFIRGNIPADIRDIAARSLSTLKRFNATSPAVVIDNALIYQNRISDIKTGGVI